MRQLVYTLFLSTNRALFHLWLMKNWVKDQKVSKCYENDSLQNFLSVNMSLSTAKAVRKSHV